MAGFHRLEAGSPLCLLAEDFNNAYARAQEAPFRTMTIPQLHRWVGSDSQVFVPEYISEKRRNSSIEIKEKRGTGERPLGATSPPRDYVKLGGGPADFVQAGNPQVSL